MADSVWQDQSVWLGQGDSLDFYPDWNAPTTIVSDGAYGILGFEGDTSDHLGLPEWYEPHIQQWAERSTPETTLWFWNTEIGWAAVHPVLEKHGWRYVSANIWNKGKGHIAGNVNTAAIRRFPVVTEVCVQYVREVRVDGLQLKQWLLREWKRTGLPVNKANEACGVAHAATRKYLDQGHLWYPPPADRFAMLADFANQYGKPDGRPYFSINGTESVTAGQWERMRSIFNCPHGVTNVWDRPALRGDERIKAPNGKAAHLNQKPLDLMKTIIEASSLECDVIWEPFGGTFSAAFAARLLGRRAFAAELDPAYFQCGVGRFIEADQSPCLL